jgi:hypothetical protein
LAVSDFVTRHGHDRMIKVPVMDFIFRSQQHDLDPATNRGGTPDGVIEVRPH